MSKANLNGVIIDTETYKLEGAISVPVDKPRRWWVYFIGIALILAGLVSYRIPTWLGLARLSDFGPVGVSIVCEFGGTTQSLEKIDEVRHIYSDFDFDYISPGKKKSRYFHHAYDNSPFRGYSKSIAPNTIYYEVGADKDTLLEIIESYENGTLEGRQQLPALIDRLRPYTDRELLEVLIVGRPENVTFLKECLDHDVVSGMRFAYQWPAKYHSKITNVYYRLIDRKHSFAWAAYALEIVIFTIILLIALIASLLLMAVLNAFDRVCEEGDAYDWGDRGGKSDFDYFGRNDYRSPEEADKDERDDEEDDEENEEED